MQRDHLFWVGQKPSLLRVIFIIHSYQTTHLPRIIHHRILLWGVVLLLASTLVGCNLSVLMSGRPHPIATSTTTSASVAPSVAADTNAVSTRALNDAVEDTAQMLSTLASSDSALVAKADRNSPLPQTLDSVHRTPAGNLDSLSRSLRRDTTIAVSNAKALADSAKLDTTRQRSGLEAPVDYTAKDSLVYDATTGFAHLYGEAKVHYQNMDLSADYITLNMDSTIVHAQGVPDSTGKAMKGTPIYKQGSENYESERMSFNFRTKKGFIEKVKTTQGNGFLRSVDSKRSDDGNFYLQDAQYTTCDADHPHFYLQLTRAKVSPGKETFFGPAYLVVADVPLPLAIPYGFFPFNKKYSSGIIMPSYGDETSRGFYLRDGGYYFALSDRMDLKLLGELYTKGSWGLSAETNYAKRYAYRGNFYVSYLTTITGEKNLPDFSKTTSLKVQWSHASDAKANPNTSFSARVNYASQNYERSNLTSLYTPTAYTQSTRASSVSFTHNIPSLGISLSGSSNITQNMRDSSLAITLPDLSINVNRFYPFRRKKAVGKERWYEKISLSYTGQFTNSINTKEDKLFHTPLLKWRNGMQHRVPIDATFQLFKYINLSPSISFSGRTYLSRERLSWDNNLQAERRDTTYGFYNLYDWNASMSFNTTLYGFYKPWRKLFGTRIQAIRHVFKPSVSFSYAPDFTTRSYGYVTNYVYTDRNGKVTTKEYSPYASGAFGYPSGKRQGSINMSISNNVEMKLKSDADTSGFRKISLIDELSASMSYNLATDYQPWSDLSTNVRLRFSPRYTFSMAARFATYAYEFDEKGNVFVGNSTEWSHGRFGRFQGMSQNISYTLDNKKMMTFFGLLAGRGWDKVWEGIIGKTKEEDKRPDPKEDSDDLDEEEANTDPMLRKNKDKKNEKKVAADVDEDGYLAFSLPWTLTFSYGVTMAEDRSKPINTRNMRYPYSFTQTLNFSGNITLAKGWNINFSSGYDFNYKKLSMTTASLSRDLHCFEMSCSIVLLPYSSFNFSFRARAAELADALKYEKRSSYSSNIDWY